MREERKPLLLQAAPFRGREPEGGKVGGLRTRQLMGMGPAFRPCQDLWQGVGKQTGVEGCPEVPGHGTPLILRASFSHPHLGSYSAGEDGCLGPLHGEIGSPSSSFPVFNLTLSFIVTSIWSWGPGAPSGGRAGPSGPGKGGKETDGRDSLGSLRPLLPRHRRSPNWRGTGFSTVFCLHSPLSPRLLQDGRSGGAVQAPLAVYPGEGGGCGEDPFGGDRPAP